MVGYTLDSIKSNFWLGSNQVNNDSHKSHTWPAFQMALNSAHNAAVPNKSEIPRSPFASSPDIERETQQTFQEA